MCIHESVSTYVWKVERNSMRSTIDRHTKKSGMEKNKNKINYITMKRQIQQIQTATHTVHITSHSLQKYSLFAPRRFSDSIFFLALSTCLSCRTLWLLHETQSGRASNVGKQPMPIQRLIIQNLIVRTERRMINKNEKLRDLLPTSI